MAVAVPDILARIVGHKRADLAQLSVMREQFERKAAERQPARDFRAALLTQPPAIIAEVKKASPSKGVFTGRYRPAEIAAAYAAGGAAALSILTDARFFQGALSDMEEARKDVRIPVLRKDFTVDEMHVVEAAAHGADAILLIASILSVVEMRRFRELAASYGMAALVEVHGAVELKAAIDSGADLIGVNNRDLHTFEVDFTTALRLADKIPSNAVKVAESGIHSPEHVRRLRAAGFDAFLVGEHLMKAGDAAAALRELRS